MAKASFLIISSLPHVKCVRVRANFIENEEVQRILTISLLEKQCFVLPICLYNRSHLRERIWEITYWVCVLYQSQNSFWESHMSIKWVNKGFPSVFNNITSWTFILSSEGGRSFLVRNPSEYLIVHLQISQTQITRTWNYIFAI